MAERRFRVAAWAALAVLLSAGCSDGPEHGLEITRSQNRAMDVLVRDGDVRVGATCTDGISLRDDRSAVSVTVRLRGAQKAAMQRIDSKRVSYRGATEQGGDWLIRVGAFGFEDFVTLPDSKQQVVHYDLELGEAVAGLRQVSGVIEFLDHRGAPRLRMAPPEIYGARGRTAKAVAVLDGCEVDHNPTPPWNRAVTAPEARHCRLSIGWDPKRITYPAVLDPSWTTTANTLAFRRRFHSASRLSDGSVLVCGGTNSAQPCEVYNPDLAAWTASVLTPQLRNRHTATVFDNSGVLFIGGVNDRFGEKDSGILSLDWLDTAEEVWNWKELKGCTLDPKQARYGHTTTRFKSGTLKVIGGRFPGGGLFRDALTVYVVDDGKGDPSCTGVTQDPQVIPFPIVHHKAHLLGKALLLTGGLTTDDVFPYPTVFPNGVPGSFEKAGAGINKPPIMKPRLYHATAKLDEEHLLVSGGFGAGTSVELFRWAGLNQMGIQREETRWTPINPLMSSRAKHTLTALVDGSVLAVGGQGGDSARNDAELIDMNKGSSATWMAAGTLSSPRREHTATLLHSGAVLIVGGSDDLDVNNEGLETSELFVRQPNGELCDAPGECATGHCVSGVCCESECGGACEQCDQPGVEGTCAPKTTGATSDTCTPYLCDGTNGQCPSACNSDAECEAGHVCGDGQCKPPKAPRSDGETCTQDEICKSGHCVEGRCCITDSCYPYRCSGDNGTCLSQCKTGLDCATGLRCNASGRCVEPTTEPNVPSNGCAWHQPNDASQPGRQWLWGLVLALLHHRRRRTRSRTDRCPPSNTESRGPLNTGA